MKIMLVPSNVLPIPSVKGGAVEQLITSLLNVNEKEQRVKFYVISVNDEEAKKANNYVSSEFFYYDKETSVFFDINYSNLIFLKYLFHALHVDCFLSSNIILILFT